jgi:hypothetical protein
LGTRQKEGKWQAGRQAVLFLKKRTKKLFPPGGRGHPLTGLPEIHTLP